MDKNRVSIQQSRASIRGSGIQEKSDRLSSLSLHAKSPNKLPQAASNNNKVIEKVVVEGNEQNKDEVFDLKARLNEAQMRQVIVGIDNDRLKKSLNNKNPIFENEMSYEISSLKAEIVRLKGVISDKMGNSFGGNFRILPQGPACSFLYEKLLAVCSTFDVFKQ